MLDKKKEIKHMVGSETYSYRGWLTSDFFLKRAFAVVGHYLVAGLIIWAVIMLIVFFVALGSALR